MDNENTKYNEFEEYLQQHEPQKRERAESWGIAIGLQAVDGLTPSKYLLETAKRHIEGDITIDEVKGLIDSYYQTKTGRSADSERTEEADKVSANITKLLNEQTFAFSPSGYASIHKRIFDGIFKFAGSFRDCNITKKEWVLQGDTVLYVGFDEIRMALEHDFEKEKDFSYRDLTFPEIIQHISLFIANLWQIHAFREGNTRTTAVFTIKYLRSMGFNVDNELFREHSWYFRNALVRANYRNIRKGVEPTRLFLEQFFRNLLMGEKHELKNRYLLINLPMELSVPDKFSAETRQVPDKLQCDNPSICTLIRIIGENKMSVREMLIAIGLKDRENFLNNYLNPALKAGWIALLYPENPRHPRQKYMLTVKGLVLFRSKI